MKYLLPLLFVGMCWMMSASSQAQQAPADLPDLAELLQNAEDDHIIMLGFSDQALNSIPASAAANFYRQRGAYQSSSWSQRMTDQIAEDYHLKKLTEYSMTEVGLHCAVYQVPSTVSVPETLLKLTQDERLEIVQQMHLYHTQAHQYNDPYFKLQTNLQQMFIDQVHTNTTGRGITIAMIDTGVALDHPDLEGQIISNENFANAISTSFSSDKHGTAVAGVMVAKKDNDTGITGIAPDAKLIALKACWPDQSHAIASLCNSFTLALAINAAIKAKVNILNMSLAGPSDPLLAILLNKAIEKGIIVVAAKANDANFDFPASLKNVIAVQSLTDPQPAHYSSTFLVTAPGEKILTTLPEGTYDFISGSSIAASEVSGVIALLLELKSDLTSREALSILQKSAVPLKTGTLRAINAKTAILALCELTTCPQEVLSLALVSYQSNRTIIDMSLSLKQEQQGLAGY